MFVFSSLNNSNSPNNIALVQSSAMTEGYHKSGKHRKILTPNLPLSIREYNPRKGVLSKF